MNTTPFNSPGAYDAIMAGAPGEPDYGDEDEVTDGYDPGPDYDKMRDLIDERP